MKRLLIALAFAPLVAPAFAPAFAQDTLADAVASALDGNPTLLAQRSTRAVADEALEQAKAAMRPQLALSGSYGAFDQDVGRSFTVGGQTFPQVGSSQRATAGLEARQTLYAGGALSAQRRQAEAGVVGAEARLDGVQQQVILAVIDAYLNVRRAEAETEFRIANVSALSQQVRAAGDRFDVGEVTRTDVAQAQSRFAGAEAELAAARARLEAARANYVEVVGRPAVQLAPPPPPAPAPESVEAAIAQAQNNNPDIVSARAAEKAAEEAIGVAKGGLRPRVGLVGSAGVIETYQDQSFRDTNLGLSAEVSIPLYQGGLASSRTRAARLSADEARYRRLAVERTVTSRVSTAWHALIASRESIAASMSRVSAAATALEGAQQELAVGTRITLDVLDQEQELLTARLGLIDAERAAYVAAHQLLAAMGQLTQAQIGR